MEPLCAWRKAELWHWAYAPVARLSLTPTQLADLPALLIQHQAQLACGVLPYALGLDLHELTASDTRIEVMLFDQLQSGAVLPQVEGSFSLDDRFHARCDDAAYAAAFARIQRYLHAGDCYQINFAQAFDASFSGSTYAGWQRLMQQHTAPHACYFSGHDMTLMSASPERFLSIEGGDIITDPIKGSRPRGQTPAHDARLAQELQNSAKDRAENLMIVDLLRNDMGAICETGSVVAERLFELKRFSNVQHLVSRVRGKLRADVSPIAALLACFPGGSITGAPKKRAMEIIHELEATPRGSYCGSFFTLDAQGTLDANILIRTFQAQGKRLRIHGGGGITVASDCKDEYDESLFKVEQLMQALG